ncbi:MAG: hypothetical protein R3Y43_04895 [Alphaproteobacteria bacterium]
MSENKKEKFKWENITAKDDCNFEMTYKHALKNLYYLKSTIQQLAKAYKAKVDGE